MRAVYFTVVLMCGMVAAAQETAPTNMTSPTFSYSAVVGCVWVLVVAACILWRIYPWFSVERQVRRMQDVVLKEIVVDASPTRPPIPTTPYTKAEVAKHNTKTDCWIVVHNLVLDVSHYARVHPGGQSILTDTAGADATKRFDTVHDLQDIEEAAPEVIIGVVSD